MKKPKKLNVSLSLKFKYSALQKPSDFEKVYQAVYKNVAAFFYQNPSCRASVFFPGQLLLWLEGAHPEFTKIFTKMVAKRQVEVLGGGFYEPLLPTVFPIDRSGQIEFLTSELRRIFGKRPRGIMLCASVWDNSLIPSLHNCGMEYAFVNSSLVPDKNPFLPYISNEKGASVKIVVQDESFVPDGSESPRDFLDRILKKSCSLPGDGFERIASIQIDEEQFPAMFDSGWMQEMFSLARGEFSDRIEVTVPVDFFSECDDFVQCYVPSGMAVGYGAGNIFDFLLSHQRSKALYNRMLHISMLLSQCRGDKGRRNSARDSLWVSQSGEAYLGRSARMRQLAYRNLVEAEKMIRDASGDGLYRDTTTRYDYDGDGHDEYIFSMGHFCACVSPRGAQIFEFDVMKNSGNYVDNDDGRGFFLSYIMNDAEFFAYRSASGRTDGVFSNCLFDEVDFNGQRNEAKLLGMGEFTDDDGNVQPVSIIKKYVANSNGFMVQFIVKNESQFALKGRLVVESNFTQMDFINPESNSYSVEAIHGSDCSSEKMTISDGGDEPSFTLPDVSFVQITDTFNDISFVYEPNENCDVIFMPISRQNGTFVASLCWNVDLTGGLEMEKTVNFAIITPKKRR